MTYDHRTHKTVLFGGHEIKGNMGRFLDDTWTYAEGKWEKWEAGPRSRPGPPCGHVLAFDENSGVVVLFGGLDHNDQPLGDTWVFDGDSWRAIAGQGPPARRYAAFAYDPDLKGCVLNGGSHDDFGQRGFGDTWLFRDETWRRMAAAFDTPINDDHGLAYHGVARQLIMFGGLAGAHGVTFRAADRWQRVRTTDLPPQSQCAPLEWDEALAGIVFHGGETGQGGTQFDTTWLLEFLKQ